jgi:hypothetical protein
MPVTDQCTCTYVYSHCLIVSPWPMRSFIRVPVFIAEMTCINSDGTDAPGLQILSQGLNGATLSQAHRQPHVSYETKDAGAPVHAMNTLLTSALNGGGLFHTSTTSPPGKKPAAPNEQEAGWAPGSVWAFVGTVKMKQNSSVTVQAVA